MTIAHPFQSELRAALEAGVIDASAYERLTVFLAERRLAADVKSASPRFEFVNVLWYMGALIVLGSMGLFTTSAFGALGPSALIGTSIVYAIGFVATGAYLWRRGLRTPGGLLITCAVGMTPLLIYGIQAMTGNDPIDAPNYNEFYVWIRSSWLPMEVGTIFAALLALAFFPFPFLVMVISFALWFMSMDLTPWLFHYDYSWQQRANVSVAFGVLVLVAAWLVDLRRWRSGDFAFWLHLFGVLTFWGGLTSQHGGGEVGKAVYCLVNVGLVLLALFLMRRVYAVFGAIGVSLYLGHLANYVFKDSILFPFALSGIGILIIAAGLSFHRYGEAIASFLARNLPSGLADFRPAHAREPA